MPGTARTSRVLGRGLLALLVGLVVFGVVSGSAAWAGEQRTASGGPGAAAAVRALTQDADPRAALALVPTDFRRVMGYTPAVVRDGGRDVLERRTGSCSSPYGPTRFGFTTACRQHDLGYDLLRYADRTGRPLGPWARLAVDRAFSRHLHARCPAAGEADATRCSAAAAGYAAAVDVNSVRQLYLVPAVETPAHWTVAALAGLVTLVLTGVARARELAGYLLRRAAGRLATAARATARRAGRVRVTAPALAAVAGVAVSVVPTMLPRPWPVQGVVSGVVALQAMGLAALVRSGVRRVRAGRPPRAVTSRGRLTALAAAAAVLAAGVALGTARSADLLHHMGMPAPGPGPLLLAVALAGVVVGTVLLAGRGLARLVSVGTGPLRRSRRLRVAVLAGVLAFTGSVVAAAPTQAAPADAAATQAVLATTTGGPPAGGGIAVGAKGRRYVDHPLTAAQISAVTSRPAQQPLRRYVGLGAAGTPQARARLAVTELDRAGGFDRRAVLLLVPTGSGWVDPAGVASAELLYGGDLASVAVQYDDVPSWVSYLRGSPAGPATASALLRAVRAHVDAMRVGHRPQVLLFGESLGALAALGADVRQADAALWVGVPGMAHSRAAAVATSPTQQVLRHADDPVAAWSPDLLWHRTPTWSGRWLPGLTFWQGVSDLVSAYWTPDGYGHRYSTEMVDAWRRATGVHGVPAGRLDDVRSAVAELAAVG